MGQQGMSDGNVESLEILLGSGDETFTVQSTLTTDAEHGGITAVHGGGGDDTVTITGGGGAASPLIIYGDSSQDGGRYTGTADVNAPGTAHTFTNPGSDTVNASASTAGVTIYGGRGNDIIYGSQAGDHLAGGSGNDEIHGQSGDDIIYGDSGFNVDLPTRVLTIVTDVNEQASPVMDSVAPGSDLLYGDEGNDIVFGDLGAVTQSITPNVLSTEGVTAITSKSNVSGDNDTLYGGAGDDILIGGTGNDAMGGNTGDDLMFGDNVTLAKGANKTSARFRVLAGNIIYDSNGNVQVTSDEQLRPGTQPAWTDWGITLLDHSGDTDSALYGSDYIAGGADDDMIFGQLAKTRSRATVFDFEGRTYAAMRGRRGTG